MSKQTYLNLPKTKEVNGEMIPYISYSQHSSYNETSDEFRHQMILKYIFGIEIESRFQAFADYGGQCGEYIETKGEVRGDMLSDKDCEILDSVMKDFPEDSQYEREVWIDRGNYFILGYEDRWEPVGYHNNAVDICDVEDFKTGNISKKASYYGSRKYGQTVLYGFAEEQKGIEVRNCFVTMLDRRGNPMSDDNPTNLELTGKVKKIETPYSSKRAEEVLLSMDDTARKLDLLKTTYEALKDLTTKL